MIWKNLVEKNFESYEISDTGAIRNRTGKIMKTNYDKHGYERLTLNCNGHSKTFKIHQLVANTFLEKPDYAEVVNHIDGNKTNNNLSNLEWTTYSYNNSHAIKNGLKKIRGTSNPANKYDEEKIHRICRLLLQGNLMHKEIAKLVFGHELEGKELATKSKMIGQIKRKERWTIISDLYF